MDPQTTHRPSIALLLRVIYQHHSQAIESALRAAGFNDIAPSAGNVFPFMRSEGITISALAELAGVRKQTMAQAVEQLERGGYVERRDNRDDRRSRLVFLTERGRTVTPVTHAAAAAVEHRWAELIGTDELEHLRQQMRTLLDKIRA
ncbi:MAG: MarR family winged helix-turn-helix transcriptional regulator [Solirubrobacteraceae bacterium]